MKMNTQKITLGDVWEDISTNRTNNRQRETDNITCRMIKNKAGSIRMSINFGIEICTLLGWKKNERLAIFRNRIQGNLLRIKKSAGTGYSLWSPNSNPCRMTVGTTFEFHKKYVLDKTVTINFDMEKDAVIIDISPLMTE
jgi:hypothetical protein